MDLLGQTLAGRYKVESRLGEGGMGSVYRATDSELFGRTVVIKVPHAAMLETAMVRERFLSEMQSLARLEHLHIIKILGAGEHEGVPYAVVQYVGGGDLRDRVPAGSRVEPEEVLGWLRSVAAALDFVHREGLCHRDVKPANIFFDDNGNAFLSDFGIATAIENLDSDATQLGATQLDPNQLTIAGTFVGSPSYAPPESIVRGISPAYDQYSLAVTVYEVLTGRFPHEETSEAALMAKNVDPPTPIQQWLPELPAAAAEAVMKGLERKARDRFDSCSAFASAFEQGLQDEPVALPPERPPWLVPALAGLGALLAAGLVFGLLSGSETPEAPQEVAPPEGVRPPPVPSGSAPLAFVAGSTAEDLRRARDLCREYQEANALDCDPVSFGDAGSREVLLVPFALDREEVTNARFAAFVEQTGHVTDAEKLGRSWHRNVESPGRDWRVPMGEESLQEQNEGHPVVHVSWADANAYCRHVGQRLPTEEEWEFAARGVDRLVFPWGDDFDALAANWNGSDVKGLQDVGAHPFGETAGDHQDLAGNAAEWTASRVGGDPVIKGGSWTERNPAALRPAARMLEAEDYTASDLGFRCVKDVPEWPSR